MKIEMIEININNAKHHTDVALLVDKPDFLEWIQSLRKKWNITKLYKPDEYDSFYKHIWEDNSGERRWNEFLEDIKKVRRGFNRTPNFDEVIIYALAFTEIPEGVYKSCYLKIIENSDNPADSEYAIIVTPHTTEPELKKEFSIFLGKMSSALRVNKDKKKKDELVANYNFGFIFHPTYKDFTARKIINKIRVWYWGRYKDVLNKTNQKPLGYKKVSELCPKNQEHDSDKGFEQCPYCSTDIDSMRHLLPEYIKLLKNQ